MTGHLVILGLASTALGLAGLACRHWIGASILIGVLHAVAQIAWGLA